MSNHTLGGVNLVSLGKSATISRWRPTRLHCCQSMVYRLLSELCRSGDHPTAPFLHSKGN